MKYLNMILSVYSWTDYRYITVANGIVKSLDPKLSREKPNVIEKWQNTLRAKCLYLRNGAM